MPFVTASDDEGKPYDGPAVIDVSKQEMVDEYKGWEPELLQLLEVRFCLTSMRGGLLILLHRALIV